MEKTLILFKPDTVERKLVGEIISRIERKGLSIHQMKMMVMSPDLAKKHYAEHLEKPFYPSLEKYMTSGPIIAMIAEGPEAIEVIRLMVGPTNGITAPPGTVRGDYGLSSQLNLIHASDSLKSAEREIELFFPGC